MLMRSPWSTTRPPARAFDDTGILAVRHAFTARHEPASRAEASARRYTRPSDIGDAEWGIAQKVITARDHFPEVSPQLAQLIACLAEQLSGPINYAKRPPPIGSHFRQVPLGTTALTRDRLLAELLAPCTHALPDRMPIDPVAVSSLCAEQPPADPPQAAQTGATVTHIALASDDGRISVGLRFVQRNFFETSAFRVTIRDEPAPALNRVLGDDPLRRLFNGRNETLWWSSATRMNQRVVCGLRSERGRDETTRRLFAIQNGTTAYLALDGYGRYM